MLLEETLDWDADRLARRCAALATDDDASPQVIWREVRARVPRTAWSWPSGRYELGREAVEIAMTTDHLNIQADALVNMAIVQEDRRGPRDEAETALATGRADLRDQGQCGAGAGRRAAPHASHRRLTQSAL